eukprot:COSAG05_NODE_12727_length_457_cov_0.572626_1_plen_32_part_10
MLAAAATVLSAAVLALKPEEFRQCRDTGFCRR